MVEHTQQALGERVTALCQDLTELALPEQVDAIFSNATFHWIPDHPKLFGRLAAALKPGGQLVAQCGGFGNIDRFRVLADEVAGTDEFAAYFTDWQGPWNYARADITAERLIAAGFVDVETWLEPKPTPLEDPEPFVRTVCLVRHLDRLPAELHDTSSARCSRGPARRSCSTMCASIWWRADPWRSDDSSAQGSAHRADADTHATPGTRGA